METGESLNVDIAAFLKKTRIKQGYSAIQVANALGLSYQTVYNTERADTNISASTLISIIKFYKLSGPEILREIFGLDTTPSVHEKLYAQMRDDLHAAQRTRAEVIKWFRAKLFDISRELDTLGR